MNSSNIEDQAREACLGLLPEKSKKRYELSYKLFKEWCQVKDSTIVSESLLLAYFLEQSKKFKAPSSLWCEYSMLKSTLLINENIDISKYPKLRAFLKRKNDGYSPKKSCVFTREEINLFLEGAPDDIYLLMKVVMIMGIAGACRGQELCDMKLMDVKETNEIIIIKIPDSKNGMARTFTITACTENKVCYLQMVKKYINIRSKIGNERFFMRYHGGRCYNQPVGKNTIAEIPCKIATYLNLDNPKGYTGHSFRRTSTTLLANTGAEVLTLKRHGGWKSGSTAESYVADSIANKNMIANKVLYHNQGGNQDANCVETSSAMLVSNETTELNVTDEENDNNIEVSHTNVNKYPNFVNNVTNCTNCNITININ